MTVNPDTTFSGNTIVEDLYIYGKLVANEDEIAEFGDVRVDGTLEVGRKKEKEHKEFLVLLLFMIMYT